MSEGGRIVVRIDRQALLVRTDLAAIITADRGQPDPFRRWVCPFHDDHHPSLGLSRDGRWFRCWSCGAKGNAIDWHMLREGLSFPQAIRQLDPGALPAETRRPGKPPASP